MSSGRLIFGIIVILIGISILFDVNILRYVIPLAIIYLGLRIIMGGEGSSGFESKSQTNEDRIERVLIFSGMNNKYLSTDFKGGSIVAVFGGGEIDLTGAKAKEKEIKLDLVAVFGGLKVKVPKNWHVNSGGAGILGAFNNNTVKEGEASTVLKTEGVAIFGGVEVTN